MFRSVGGEHKVLHVLPSHPDKLFCFALPMDYVIWSYFFLDKLIWWGRRPTPQIYTHCITNRSIEGAARCPPATVKGRNAIESVLNDSRSVLPHCKETTRRSPVLHQCFKSISPRRPLIFKLNWQVWGFFSCITVDSCVRDHWHGWKWLYISLFME